MAIEIDGAAEVTTVGQAFANLPLFGFGLSVAPGADAAAEATASAAGPSSSQSPPALRVVAPR